MAAEMCAAYGLDLWGQVAVVAMAERDQIELEYTAGYVRCYLEYSRDMWYVTVAETIYLAACDEPLGEKYPLNCDAHFGAG